MGGGPVDAACAPRRPCWRRAQGQGRECAAGGPPDGGDQLLCQHGGQQQGADQRNHQERGGRRGGGRLPRGQAAGHRRERVGLPRLRRRRRQRLLRGTARLLQARPLLARGGVHRPHRHPHPQPRALGKRAERRGPGRRRVAARRRGRLGARRRRVGAAGALDLRRAADDLGAGQAGLRRPGGADGRPGGACEGGAARATGGCGAAEAEGGGGGGGGLGGGDD
mmetsp:Transcript_35349/g.84485  ORF Transcript_35349/g.84485 Transcript_35349/m.84485 type:complete len:223 (-) Transcript_35349:67-735(-)